jgi:hypothetical protein
LILLFETGTYKKGSLSFIPRLDLSGAPTRPGRRPPAGDPGKPCHPPGFGAVQRKDAALNFDLQEIRTRIFQGMAAHVMGEMFLHIDDKHMDVAEARIRKAVEADDRNRMPWYLAWDYALYAEFFEKKGNPAQAKGNLHKAIEQMRGWGADGWVIKCAKELALLSSRITPNILWSRAFGQKLCVLLFSFSFRGLKKL